MRTRYLALVLAAGTGFPLFAQPDGPPPGFPPGGPGRGFGPPMMQETKLVAQFDKDGDKRLDADERKAAREFHLANRANGRGGPGGPGGRFPGPRGGFGRGGEQEPVGPGEKLAAADVKAYGAEALYDVKTLRTLFLDFESTDWEKEMEDFNRTDVDIPATLQVDGKTYRDVGVHFRGMSSYMMVGTGRKRSLNVTLDYAREDQNLLGYRTLNLLNAHEDPSFIRSALFSRIAQEYVPAPKVNFVRVVIGGENWGVYGSAEQFNKDFLKSRFGSSKGARWKVGGSPGGRGGLAYLGDDASAYKRIYEIKSKDDAASWAKLIRVCKLLEETPPEQLEAALAPHLDVDGALKFLALDVTFANGDGFWTRASDYTIGEDDKGRLHVIPHDMNETFSFGGGPGGRGGPRGPGGPGGPGGPDVAGGPGGNVNPGFGPGGERPRGEPGEPGRGPGGPGGPGGGRGGFGFPGAGGGPTLDPLAAIKNPNAALAAKLLAVPALRTRYLGYVREMAETWLDWKKLGPIAREFHDLIDADVKRDTRKLESYAAFSESLVGSPRSLQSFADQRRAFLLNHPEIKKLGGGGN
ncbi:CotH kinase family protein [Horticoccus sp. 23ND18S-11]|uniref:CotH kinase family protein n=1 Tax=Horticoccus sp. 23ND18S-11 TaxID=3391832 RepID=UPI0039C8DCF9